MDNLNETFDNSHHVIHQKIPRRVSKNFKITLKRNPESPYCLAADKNDNAEVSDRITPIDISNQVSSLSAVTENPQQVQALPNSLDQLAQMKIETCSKLDCTRCSDVEIIGIPTERPYVILDSMEKLENNLFTENHASNEDDSYFTLCTEDYLKSKISVADVEKSIDAERSSPPYSPMEDVQIPVNIEKSRRKNKLMHTKLFDMLQDDEYVVPRFTYKPLNIAKKTKLNQKKPIVETKFFTDDDDQYVIEDASSCSYS